MSDSHYLEADGEHTAGGRRMASYDRYRCPATRITGFSNVYECALPIGHDDTHETFGGTSWADATPACSCPSQSIISDGPAIDCPIHGQTSPDAVEES